MKKSKSRSRSGSRSKAKKVVVETEKKVETEVVKQIKIENSIESQCNLVGLPLELKEEDVLILLKEIR